jgi:Shedu protein SduA, C-terminal
MSMPPWGQPAWDDERDDHPGLAEDDAETVYAVGRLPGRTYASRTFPVAGELSRDAGQPARFIYKVFHNGEESELILEGDEWLIRETDAGRYQFKLMVAREAGRVKSLWIQRLPGPGRGGKVRTLMCLDRDNSAALIEFLRNLTHIPVEGGTSVRVDDALVRDLFASPGSLVTVYRKDPDRFRQLITDDASARDLIAVSHRRQQVEKFRQLLYDAEYFDSEAAKYPRVEDVWQNFFESNPWILGASLAGQLLTCWNNEKLEQVVVGSSIKGPGKRADALLRTAGRIRSMVFAEFKTHRTDLLVRESYYRSGCWAPAKHLAGGVAQVQGTVHLAVQDIGDRLAELAPDDTEIPGDFTYLIKPRSFLIIGMLSEFTGQYGGHDRARFRSFQLYRRSLIEPEIVTFDELLAKADYLAEVPDVEA